MFVSVSVIFVSILCLMFLPFKVFMFEILNSKLQDKCDGNFEYVGSGKEDWG